MPIFVLCNDNTKDPELLFKHALLKGTFKSPNLDTTVLFPFFMYLYVCSCAHVYEQYKIIYFFVDLFLGNLEKA